MNYREARAYLLEAGKAGSRPGLETIGELLRRLGNPQDRLRFIHVAGTNGKGSLIAYLAAVLKEAGYRTGSYTSPAVFSYRERYQVNGEYISEEVFARQLSAAAEAGESMRRDGQTGPTCFELETAAAFLYFLEQGCELVVLEAGMGGLLDATNIIKTTVLEVLVSISLDHMDFLGSTLGEIARQKAGIIKPGTRVVSAAQEPEAEVVIREIAAAQHSALQVVESASLRVRDSTLGAQSFDYKQWKNVRIQLAGAYQFKNAALALEGIEALRALGYEITDAQALKGMYEAVWRGRFTQILARPTVILDGAHNEAAAVELRRSLELYFSGRELYYIMAVFKDKEYRDIIALTAPLARHVIAVETPGNPRALPAEELREAIAEVQPSVESAVSIRKAVQRLLATVDPDAVIVIFGSLSVLGEAEQAVREASEELRADGVLL